ncbi:MAG: threonine--tRNA ligase [Planctomycetes bacterium]|nr:threonine--tRNA ligase [Planctomycetota bacterium]
MAQVRLPDGTIINAPDGTTVQGIAEQIGSGLARVAIAGEVDGVRVDLSTAVSGEVAVKIITAKNEEGLEIIRHSCGHIMAEAICSIWPEAKLVYGPTVRDGFYYDIDLGEAITPEDFAKIEAKMVEIIKADKPFARIELGRQEALGRVSGSVYKTDNIERAEGDVLSFYCQGDFEDLCRGPHVPSTGKIDHKAVKIMSVAGAYWHGDASKQMLQRVYGTAWANKKELKAYLFRIEEAKKRDHRVLGKQMDLFSFHKEGPGFAFLHPKGMVIWNEVIDYWRSVHTKYDYGEIKTPIILDQGLWKKSGHWDNYKENMYFTTVDDVDYAIKPMNCPGGLLVYKANKHSYREFPIRMAELGLVHRYESSGQLHGLVRVRQFTQDDAHIFCKPDQIESEIIGVIELVQELYSAFGFKDYHIELSTMPEKRIGSDEIWETATAALRAALERKGLEFQINEGDGAFYGPKIDFHIEDCLQRSWQLGTIQLDFSMPERFELVYTDKDNTEKTPVMIHRAILGSLERFMGILIEHFGGNMPLWLAPEQMRVLPISDKTADYADVIYNKLRDAGMRCTVDCSPEKIGAKIAKAHGDKVGYMLVAGPQEAENGTVSVRMRGSKESKTVKIDELIAIAKGKIADKALELEF